jgi:flavin reductase (DIM6/NTAB) family NADH-FMN oxidoreductase RutF
MTTTQAIARALERIPYGLYVVGSLRDGNPVTMIANWVTQVSFHPPCVAIAVENSSKMRRYIESSNFFCVNILPAGATGTAKAFLKSPEAVHTTIAGKEFSRGKNGTPFLHEASASIECRVRAALPSGDHMLFVGEVVDAAAGGKTDEVLTLRETGWKYTK